LVCAGILIFNGESFFPNLSEGAEGPKITAFIPNKDRKRLEYFFRRLMFWEDGAYVLMGSKPCSITVFQDSLSFSSIMPSNLRFWLGWRTWKKYENHFSHPCFSIVKENKKNGDSLLVFVNNIEFKRTIASYRDDFDKILQRSIEPDQVLSDAESQPLFSGVLQNNDFLIGILLGYGRGNSWLYYLNHQLYREGLKNREYAKEVAQIFWSERGAVLLNTVRSEDEKSGVKPTLAETDFSVTSGIPESSKKMTSFVEPNESERFSKYIAFHGVWGFAKGSLFSDISKIQLPGFVVDSNDLETIELRGKYSADRRRIIEYFDRKNFLDATLELLMKIENNI
jgi:hypothetical protein